jgi:hypothetical protein
LGNYLNLFSLLSYDAKLGQKTMDHYNSAQQSPVHFLEKLEAKQINNNASTFLGKARSMHVLSLSFSVTQV